MRTLEESPAFVEQLEQGVTYAEKISSEDRLLDPARPAGDAERVVRALHPHIGARVELADGTSAGGAPRDARRSARARARACGVLEQDGRLLLDCRPGLLELLEVQPPGGRAMDAAAYLRGHGLPGRR